MCCISTPPQKYQLSCTRAQGLVRKQQWLGGLQVWPWEVLCTALSSPSLHSTGCHKAAWAWQWPPQQQGVLPVLQIKPGPCTARTGSNLSFDSPTAVFHGMWLINCEHLRQPRWKERCFWSWLLCSETPSQKWNSWSWGIGTLRMGEIH